MIKSVFLHEFKQRQGVTIAPDVIFFRKPLQIYFLVSDKSVYFDSIEEAFKFKLNGKTVEQIIEAADMNLFLSVYNVNKSKSGGKRDTFKFNHASGGGNGEGKADLPARMNTKIKTKTQSAAVAHFAATHANDDYESAVTVDRDGFVTQYVHGGGTSVAIQGRKNELTVHNHPFGGNFSDSDLYVMSQDSSSGIVAAGSKGNYTITKGTHFDGAGFTKAVKNARMTGTDYDSAADAWLKKNQKKYGYNYSFTKATATTKATKSATTKTVDYKIDKNGQLSLF